MSDQKICKSYLATKTTHDDAERTVTAVISTDSVVDRDLEVVVTDGLDFTEFLANPVVLANHSYKDAPIGRCLSIERTPEGIVAKTQFSDTQRGLEYWQLFSQGYMKGFSIGFIPNAKLYGPPTVKELQIRPEWKGAARLIRSARVFEYSVSSIPSNPAAMARAWQAGQLPFISKSLADELRITDPALTTDPAATPPPLPVVPFVTARQFKKALKKTLKDLAPGALMTAEEVKALVAERYRVVVEGKVA